MPLETYRNKRHFDATPEPAGRMTAGEGRSYVIHKHDASRLHYDLRLELDGVLLSWAVPKGPSLDPHDRHLAVHVEDHPVEYGSFEGTIPEGEYGAGAVEIWDRGWWEPEGDPHAGLEKGDLKFTLHGEKLQGSWVLVRMKGRSKEEGKDNWLLIKHRDEHAVDGGGSAILEERPESVASGRTIDEIGAGIDVRELTGARRVAGPPDFVPPQLASLVTEAPESDQWLHEIKFDGYRAVSRIENHAVTMLSRNEKDWTARWKPIAEELASLPVSSAVLDGEVVVEVDSGRTDFGTLQHDIGTGRTDRLLYYVFDITYLDGYDLTGVALEQRKALLPGLLAGLHRVHYSEDIRGSGPTVLEAACDHSLEGVVSKKANARYRPGVRGPDWLKTKCLQRQEFVIVGWTPPSGTRIGFGALLLAVTDPDGALRYVGKVGTGFSDHFLRDFGEKLRKIEASAPTVERGIDRAPKGAHWVSARYVGEVAFVEWTGSGNVRHQRFVGLREDKAPEDVRLEEPTDPEAPAQAERAAASGPDDRGARSWGTTSGTTPSNVVLTHPERVFWPETGTSKAELARYYTWVAPYIMPYVLHRPVSMVRCPEGVGDVKAAPRSRQPGPCFFHKHAGPDFPGPFERVVIQESEGPGAYLTVTEPDSLIALAQMGVLEIHIWGATWPDIERPDLMVFDLDPADDVSWANLAAGARLVRDLLKGLGLESFLKTTGGKGLHVCVPLEPSLGWEETRLFAAAVANATVAYAPDKYIATMAKARRTGKVFVDYLRNTRSATFVAPYSTRARTRPTISVPLRWDELGGGVRPDTYDIGNLRRRLSRLSHDPWEGFFEVRQHITPAMQAEIGARTTGR